MEIRKLTASNEETFKKETDTFYDLGIISQKSAVLLNFLLAKKLSQCPAKRGCYYYTKAADTVNGGGLLVKGGAQITINDLNELGIYFRYPYSIGKYIRVASGRAEVIKSIKDKIGNELKKLWKSLNTEKVNIDLNEYTTLYGTNEKLTLNPSIVKTLKNGNKVIEISLNEYRALYEFLKGREPEKIKERTGSAAYDMMIGHQIEDQFVIAAVDVIKNEIKNTEQEFTDLCKQADDEFNESYRLLIAKRDEAKKAAKTAKENKIIELQTQLKDLLNSTIGAAA